MAETSSDQHIPVSKRLEGKVALITGAAQNVGASTAEMFVRNGAKVVIVDINAELGQSVCDKLGLENATFVYGDVTSESDVENAVNAAVSKHGKLDIMVNNAAVGGTSFPSVTESSLEDFDSVMRVNVAGVFLGIKHAARVMIPAKRGCIINLGSISGKLGGITSYAYCSSKHAVLGLTRNAAAELGKHGIRVNCLSSHAVLIPAARKYFGMDEDGDSKSYTSLEGVDLRHEDLAMAAVYLGSDESRFMSGHDLMLDV